MRRVIGGSFLGDREADEHFEGAVENAAITGPALGADNIGFSHQPNMLREPVIFQSGSPPPVPATAWLASAAWSGRGKPGFRRNAIAALFPRPRSRAETKICINGRDQTTRCGHAGTHPRFYLSALLQEIFGRCADVPTAVDLSAPLVLPVALTALGGSRAHPAYSLGPAADSAAALLAASHARQSAAGYASGEIGVGVSCWLRDRLENRDGSPHLLRPDSADNFAESQPTGPSRGEYRRT